MIVVLTSAARVAAVLAYVGLYEALKFSHQISVYVTASTARSLRLTKFLSESRNRQ